MKVSGLGTVRGNATRRTSAKPSGDRGFRVDADEAETATPAVTGGGAVQGVGALLSLQEVPDATEERSRGLKHGRDLLDELEKIRLGLLLGRIPRSRLEHLLRLTRQRAQQF